MPVFEFLCTCIGPSRGGAGNNEWVEGIGIGRITAITRHLFPVNSRAPTSKTVALNLPNKLLVYQVARYLVRLGKLIESWIIKYARTIRSTRGRG